MLLLLPVAIACASPTPALFVQRDVVNVREAPARDADVVARLRLNTEVTVLDATPAWAHITLAARPDVVGYVARELLGDAPRDVVDAANVEDDTPLWLAYCDGSRAVLLAYDDGKRLHQMTEGRRADTKSLVQAARAAVGARWYGWLGELAPESTPFPTPFGAPIWNDETHALTPAPGTKLDALDNSVAPIPLEAAEKLVLGPCPADQRGLLATTPLERTKLRGIPIAEAQRRSVALYERWRTHGFASDAEAKALASHSAPRSFAGAADGSATLTRTESLRVLDGSTVFTSVSVDALWGLHDGEERGVQAAFVITDDDGRDVIGHPTSWSGDDATQVRLSRRGRSLLLLPVAAMDEGGDAGFVIATERDGAIELLHVVTDRAGC